MKLSKIVQKVQARSKPKDRFFTPKELAAHAISMVEAQEGEVWWEPFYGEGVYYDQYPKNFRKTYTEIELGLDAFEYTGPADIVSTNPPYSLLSKVIEMLIEKNPRVIQLLIGTMNLTMPRVRKLEAAGYYMKKLHYCDIHGWFGSSIIVQFELKPQNPTEEFFKQNITSNTKTYKRPGGRPYMCKEDQYIEYKENWVVEHLQEYF